MGTPVRPGRWAGTRPCAVWKSLKAVLTSVLRRSVSLHCDRAQSGETQACMGEVQDCLSPESSEQVTRAPGIRGQRSSYWGHKRGEWGY